MKKTIKKLTLIFLILLSTLSTNVYSNTAIDAMEKSANFLNKHKFLVYSTHLVSIFIQLTFKVFIIVIPIIIIYKSLKLKNNQNERDRYIVKTLGIAELLCIFNTYIITQIARLLYGHGSESTLYANIFIILVSLLSIGIILFKLLKKNKN